MTKHTRDVREDVIEPEPPPVEEPRDLSFPKNMYRAIFLDGIVTVYYDDHGETKIHPQCICTVQSSEGEKHVSGEGWHNTPQEAYDAMAGVLRAAELRLLEAKVSDLKRDALKQAADSGIGTPKTEKD